MERQKQTGIGKRGIACTPKNEEGKREYVFHNCTREDCPEYWKKCQEEIKIKNLDSPIYLKAFNILTGKVSLPEDKRK